MRRRSLMAALPMGLPLGLLAACAADGPAAPRPAEPVRVVFFEDDSIALGPPALTVIQATAAAAQRNPAARLRVQGYIAPDPTHAPVVALSRARAEHVANELVRLGVDRGRITVEGRGVGAVADVPLEARRVEIHFVGV
jgi:outer membrane protein OmpA-like peptidoglycan-associated protein